MRVSATNAKVRPEELLPPELAQQVQSAVAQKMAETEERIERAKLRLADAKAAHRSAHRVQAIALSARANARGVTQKTDGDIELGIECTKAYAAVQAAQAELVTARILQRDLKLLERQAKAGLRCVVQTLADRWSGRVLIGGEMERLDPAALARQLHGLGDASAGAMGPIERLQRRLNQERENKVKRELRKLEEADRKRREEEEKAREEEEKRKKKEEEEARKAQDAPRRKPVVQEAVER